MNQQQKIQRLIDYCGELDAEVCEARRWAIHYRRKCDAYWSEIDDQYDTIWEKEVENAELRAGLVFYAIENTKLTGTMRDADDAHGMTPGINRSNYCPRCGANYPVQPDGSFFHTCPGVDLGLSFNDHDPTDCDCDACEIAAARRRLSALESGSARSVNR